MRQTTVPKSLRAHEEMFLFVLAAILMADFPVNGATVTTDLDPATLTTA